MPLWTLIVMAFIVMAAVGLGVRFYADSKAGPQEVTWLEYGVSLALIAVVVCPLVGWAGTAMAKKDNVTYHEFWNGWEARAQKIEIACSRDGACRFTYDCDPYEVRVEYDCGDDKHPKTCTRWETRYHQCPYVTAEYNYSVITTLGAFTIGTHRFPEHPRQHRWEAWRFEGLPDYIIGQAGTGDPRAWTAAKERIDRNDPGPVTVVKNYDNLILASHYTILKRYREEANEYRSSGLLPPITSTIRQDSFYRSDKVSLVGCPARDYSAWDDALEKLNAASGSELQGDVRLVLVCNQRATAHPDAYRYALEAYWQDTELWKRSALSKNSIVAIVGTTDGKTAAWGRAFTGMPVGNANLEVAIQSRLMATKSVPWTPAAIIGPVTGRVGLNGETFTATSIRQSGVLTDVLWGVGDRSTRFARVSMKAKDPGDIGTGFTYLASEIVLTGAQKFWILFFVCVISAIVFSVVSFNDFFNAKR